MFTCIDVFSVRLISVFLNNLKQFLILLKANKSSKKLISGKVKHSNFPYKRQFENYKHVILTSPLQKTCILSLVFVLEFCIYDWFKKNVASSAAHQILCITGINFEKRSLVVSFIVAIIMIIFGNHK